MQESRSAFLHLINNSFDGFHLLYSKETCVAFHASVILFSRHRFKKNLFAKFSLKNFDI